MYSFIFGGFVSFLIIFNHLINYYIEKQRQYNNIDKYVVYIVRGLKGSGKSSWVNEMETKMSNEYNLVYNEKDFYECDFFEFMDSKESSLKNHEYLKCYTNCINKFISLLENETNRIYLTVPFPESWEYSNFIYIANLFNYKIKYIEIACDSVDQAKFFQQRSPHKKISYLNNTYTYKNIWKNDKRFEKICANIDECPGESLPYPKVTKELLDNELNIYMSSKINHITI